MALEAARSGAATASYPLGVVFSVAHAGGPSDDGGGIVDVTALSVVAGSRVK